MAFRRQHIRNIRSAIEAGTPLVAEYVYDQTLGTIRAGDGATLGGALLAKWGKRYTLSPAQITADQNDYTVTDLAIAERMLLTSDALRNITGLQTGATDKTIELINKGSFNIVLKDASASSAAANRFSFGADVTLRPKQGIKLAYDSAASRWIAAGDIFGFKGVTNLPENVTRTGVISPAQLTANTNDWTPAGLAAASVIRVSTDASRNLTGLAAQPDGTEIEIYNVGTNPFVLKNQDAGSTVANRFLLSADVTLSGDAAIQLRYDGTTSRWRQKANTAGAAVADGAVTAVKLATSALGARVGLINGTIVESRAGSAVTFAIKNLLGNDPSAADPVLAVFQNGTGGFVIRSITAALAITISSGGSLGVANNTAFRVWVVLFDNAGTVVLGAINCRSSSSILPLNEWTSYSSTPDNGSGNATSAQVIYTPTGVTVASKFLCIVGFATYESGLAAAGTWNVAPSSLALFGPGVTRPGQPTGLFNQTLKADTFSTSNTTLTDITGLSVSLTPASKANPVLVTGNVMLACDTSSNGGSIALLRGATNIGGGTPVSNRPAGIGQGLRGTDSANNLQVPFNYLDFAQVSASTAWKVQGKAQSPGTININRTAGDPDTTDFIRGASSITVQEIMG